jgi:hypothetical protein
MKPQLKIALAMLAGILVPGLGRLAYTNGWVDRNGAVLGAFFIMCAVAMFLFRRSVPVSRVLVPVLGALTGGLILLGVLPLPEFVASFAITASLIIFLVLDAVARRKQSMSPKA